MNQEIENELSPEEQQAFERLPREKAPPPLLEERVVQSLKHSGLLSFSPKFSGHKASRAAMAVAASLLFFILGAAVMKWLSTPAQKTNTPEFMLVLRETSEQLQRESGEEQLRIAKEYGNWARQLSHQGVLADGEKLKDEARFLSTVNGHSVTSRNPVDRTGDAIAGYFLIKAQDYEQAVKVAQTCPHLKYGGTIEVREIDRF